MKKLTNESDFEYSMRKHNRSMKWIFIGLIILYALWVFPAYMALKQGGEVHPINTPYIYFNT